MIMPLLWLWHHLVWHWDKWSHTFPNKFITTWGGSHHFAQMSHRPAIMSLIWANLWFVGGMACLSTRDFSSGLMAMKAKLPHYVEAALIFWRIVAVFYSGRMNRDWCCQSLYILKHYKYQKWLYMCYISSFKNSNNSFVFLKPESSRPQSLWSSVTRKNFLLWICVYIWISFI